MGGLVAASSEPSASPALRPGHAIDLLKGGEALFAALVQAIDAARAEVLLESYIFEFAGAPLHVAEALERAAARSVRVRVVVDGIGTGDVPAGRSRTETMSLCRAAASADCQPQALETHTWTSCTGPMAPERTSSMTRRKFSLAWF